MKAKYILAVSSFKLNCLDGQYVLDKRTDIVGIFWGNYQTNIIL